MKKLFLLGLCSLMLFSCQDEGRKEVMQAPKEEKVQDSIPELVGEFIYGEDAAVLRGEDFVYGVKLDSMSRALAEKVEPYKTGAFDMVPVKVKAKIIPNMSRTGWDKILEIREIIDVLEKVKNRDTLNIDKKS